MSQWELAIVVFQLDIIWLRWSVLRSCRKLGGASTCKRRDNLERSQCLVPHTSQSGRRINNLTGAVHTNSFNDDVQLQERPTTFSRPPLNVTELQLPASLCDPPSYRPHYAPCPSVRLPVRPYRAGS